MSVADGGHEQQQDFVAEWLRLIRRRVPWAVAVFGVIMALAAAVVFLSRPVYRAEARLRLGEPPPMSGVSPTAGIFSFLQLGGDPFSNDLELLGSRSLAEELVRDVALQVRLDAPRGFHRDSLVTALSAADSTVKETFSVTWTDATTVSVRRTSPTDSVIGAFQSGTSVRFGGVRATFRSREPWGPEEIEISTLPFGELVPRVSSALSLTRTRREANVLVISYAHTDPAVTVAVVEGAVAHFLAMRAQLMERESAETVDSLRTVARATEVELLVAEAAVEELQRSTGMIDPDAQSEALIQRYEESVGALETARAELEALELQLARVEQATDPIEAWTTLVAHPRFLENQTVGDILGRLAELQAELTAVTAGRTSARRDVQTLQAQIGQMDGALRTLATEFRGALSGQVVELELRVASMDTALSRIPEQVLELGRRQRTARVLAELLIITEQRLRQEEIRQALTFSNVQVIDSPALWYRPIWPRKKLGLAVGFLLAAGCALLTVVVVEKADGRIHSEVDVRAATGAPVLFGVVRSKSGLRLTEQDAAAFRHGVEHAGADRVVTVASVSGGTDPGGVIEALTDLGVTLEMHDASLHDFGAAVGAAARGGVVVLVIQAGHSTRSHTARAARLVEEAGGRVAGTIVVADSSPRLEALWA